MTAVASAASASVLADLRRARRRQRVADIHWIDALYQVYITAILVVVAVLVASGLAGGDQVSDAEQADVLADGPALLGLVAAAVVMTGLRSGCRGGPLALERADVRHVLLAPVDRGAALRAPALRQVRFLSFVALAVGATAGQLAARRLDGNAVVWVLCGAGFCLAVIWLASGLAMVAAGHRWPRWLGTLGGLALVGWAAADLAGPAPPAPTSVLARVALWPIEFDPLALGMLAVAVGALALGLIGLSGLSLEAAERRTALVGQLKFAVTLQDLRTVLVLRRQLAMETPRPRPWLARTPGHPDHRRSRFPVWQRGWWGLRRFPAPRLVRLVVLAAVAGLALRGAWVGTTPLAVVGGLALWVAALDVIEPLSQETDHPGRSDSYPGEKAHLMVRHLPAPALGMVLVGLLGAGAAVLAGPSVEAVEVAAVATLPAALAATAGAVASVLMGAPQAVDQLSMLSPEIAGARTVVRTVWPPLVAVVGTAPVLAARAAADTEPANAVPVAAAVGLAVLGLVGLVVAWVRYRDRARAAFERSVAEAKAAQEARTAA